MFKPRLIPVLLLKDGVLVKSVRFKSHNYIGDPINAVRIFNEFGADELFFLDIAASKNKTVINFEIVRKIGEEADMPFAVGGGITKLSEIRELINAGAEKVVLGAMAVADPNFVKQAADEFGSSTIGVCIDVKKNFWGKQMVCTNNAGRTSRFQPQEFALLMEEMGAGELIVQSVDRDGTMSGYDLELIQSIADTVTIPTVALGGVGCIDDFRQGRILAHATGLAAGSFFIYYGKNKGVLINYPRKNELTF